MTRDANTCINSTYKRQDGTWGYVGGYDLMISKLTQVSEGKVVGQIRGEKIVVYKYKSKKNYRRKQGHRQPYTKVEITKIAL